MTKLLYLQCSPRIGRSYSIAVADAFLAAYKAAHPADTIATIDLFKASLPTFDGPALNAKYRILHGETATPEERKAWQAVEGVIKEFTSADKYLLAVPMWNFGIPYRLKHYIDVLTQPGYTFAFSPEKGYSGLVLGKSAYVVYARGGEYPAGTAAEAYDFQKKYLELALGFIGITNVGSIVVEPTLAGGPETAAAKREAALTAAAAAGKTF